MKAGDVFVVWDMYARHWHVWLMLRPCTDKDVRTYPSDVGLMDYGVGDCGEYWMYVNLVTGNPRITIDNMLAGWELL